MLIYMSERWVNACLRDIVQMESLQGLAKVKKDIGGGSDRSPNGLWFSKTMILDCDWWKIMIRLAGTNGWDMSKLSCILKLNS